MSNQIEQTTPVEMPEIPAIEETSQEAKIKAQKRGVDKFQSLQESAVNAMRNSRAQFNFVEELKNFLAYENFAAIESVSVYLYHHSDTSNPTQNVYIYLSQDALSLSQRAVAVAMAHMTGVQGNKKPSGKSLRIDFAVPKTDDPNGPKDEYVISGYIPETCTRVKFTEEVAPSDKPTIHERYEIACTPEALQTLLAQGGEIVPAG